MTSGTPQETPRPEGVLTQPHQDPFGLEKAIAELQGKVAPLYEEAQGSPMWELVARIMNLGKSDRPPSEIRDEIRECERLLNEMAFDWVKQVIAVPEPSKVFQVVNNVHLFERKLTQALGARITLKSGHNIEFTSAMLKFLTRFKFSIGTPPITRKGMETIERILFSGQLSDIYGFRNLLGAQVDVFDRFMRLVERTVEQSTHYTTPKEREEAERTARDFLGMEGVRKFPKTAVSGSGNTACRLIKEHVLSKYGKEEAPLVELEVDDLGALDERGEKQVLNKLVAKMQADRTKMFLVKAKKIPHGAFSDETFHAKWHGVLGRLILVEDSDISQKTTTTMVYSFNPEIIQSLAGFHIKDSGTLANTQLNLRAMAEEFSQNDIADLKKKVEEAISYMRKQRANSQDFTDDRKKEWVVSNQKDYVSLQRFKRFLEFIEKIKTGGMAEVEELKQKMVGIAEGMERNYFFKDLPKDKYDCIYVPQGGGRREIGLIGQYHLGKHRQKVDEFRKTHLAQALAKLHALKMIRELPAGISPAAGEALQQAHADRQSPDAPIRDLEGKDSQPVEDIREFVRTAVSTGVQSVDNIVKNVIIKFLDKILGNNIPGLLKSRIARQLQRLDLASASKIFERPPFRRWANIYRQWERIIYSWVREALEDTVLKATANVGRKLGNHSLDLAQQMLNEIEENGAFEPSLALAKIGWTFGDVLREADFPTQKYLTIDMEKDGELKIDSLEKRLEKMREDLHEFPELFKLYCSSILLIFNDPHNPTSKVADPQTKVKLLSIASRYGIAILADEAYHKMIEKDLKEEEGDPPLASFYHQHPGGFPKPVTIYSSLPSTKWGMGAGRRSGNILTNDLSSHTIMDQAGTAQCMTFEQFVRKNTDGVNIMSLWFDIETLKTGLTVKEVCKKLEETMLNPANDPTVVIEEILSEMVREIDSPDFQGPVYFKLLQARNDMDRLTIRINNPFVRGVRKRQYISGLIKELKELRLDKQTRKDTEERIKAGTKAIKRLSKKIPGLEQKYIKPEGPFYLCVTFDETRQDLGLKPFIEAFAKARGIDGVEVDEGNVRFSFGAMLDGSTESYEMLSVGFEQALELSLQYWERFKEIRRKLHEQGNPAPIAHAIHALFPKDEDEAQEVVKDREKIIHFHELLQESNAQDALEKIAKELDKRSHKIATTADEPESSITPASELGDILNVVLSKDIALILRYLKKYKLLKAQLDEQQDDEAELHALQKTFEGEEDLPENSEALKILMGNFARYKEKGKVPLVSAVSSDASEYISQIHSGAAASIVTIHGVACSDMEEFIKSRPFQTLFDHCLIQVKDKIPGLKGQGNGEILGNYGALKFAEKITPLGRKFEEGEKELFAQIAMEVAKVFYSDMTIKVLAENYRALPAEEMGRIKGRVEKALEGIPAATREAALEALGEDLEQTAVPPEIQKKAMVGASEMVNRFIQEFLRVFLTEEQERSLTIKPAFQVGYQSIRGVKASDRLQPWMKKIGESTEFVGQTVDTDPAPEMITEGTTRVAGFDYGIYRRDGDGKNAPTKQYFRKRLEKFAETINTKDYVCKMVQVGPVRTLLVMNRAYTHYLAEEMRLFPQFDLSKEDISSLEVDAISLMGIPQKAMGSDYKVGYFMDEDTEGRQIPVSWVAAEKLTDYVGYLKKPLLTVANEKVKESGGMPVHGSAFTIVFKNGLRKTIVIGGDSGAGKSETIIAMIEQAVKEEGKEMKEVDGIDMLAGDMLSMYEGEDNQMYMFGTEEGDFMRMPDIAQDWKKRFRDRLKKASVTNRKHPTNPRATIGGLCDPEGFLRPVRVNMFFHIDNYTVPKGRSFQEIRSQKHLVTDIYVKGYRREKGTSGDQPNLVASLKTTNNESATAILDKYGKDLDILLGWQTSLADSGKVKKAVLSFRDVPGKVATAKSMVKKMFKNKKFTDENGKTWTIENISYDFKSSQFGVVMNSGSKKIKKALDRSVFDRIYDPIAATYAGNPFVNPEGMGEVLERFAGVMQKAGVITGVLFSQLAVDGKRLDGPETASQDVVRAIAEHSKINIRFQNNQKKVQDALTEKYGEIIGPQDLPKELKAFNLHLLERHESNTIKLVDKNGNHIDIRTPKYRYNSGAARRTFEASLVTPEVKSAIRSIADSKNHRTINLDDFRPDTRPYSKIKTWNSKEELIYQIMIINETVRLGQDYGIFQRHPIEVKKAVVIAEKIIGERRQTA